MKKIATCILVLLLLFCSVGMSACKKDETENDGKFVVKLAHWANRSPDPTNLIWVEYGDKNISCSIVSKRGRISKVDSSKENAGTTFSVKEKAKYTDIFWGTGRDYISILLFKNNQVVGYALIEVTMLKDPEDLIPRILVEQEMETPITAEEATARIAQVEEVAREDYNSSKSTFLYLFDWRYPASVRSNGIVIDYDDNDDVTCKFVCKQGAMWIKGYQNVVREAEVGVYQVAFWSHFVSEGEYVSEDEVSIFLMKNGQVIGYAALEVKRDETSRDFVATILVEELLETPISEEAAIANIEAL